MDKITICNMALALVKQAGIKSLDENNERARVCKMFYDHSRKSVLCRHRWNFATSHIKLSQLAVDDSEKIEGYDFYYQYPLNALQLITLHSGGDYDTKLSVKEVYLPVENQRCIVSTEEDVEGVFVIDIEDTALFSTLFTRVLSLDLASNIASVLTGNDALAKDLLQRSEFALNNAENNNSAEYWGTAERESDTFKARSS